MQSGDDRDRRSRLYKERRLPVEARPEDGGERDKGHGCHKEEGEAGEVPGAVIVGGFVDDGFGV